MGVEVIGLFLGYSVYPSDDGNGVHCAIDVACGRNAYCIYLSDGFDSDYISALDVGDKITIKCRPYVNTKGRLAWTAGEIVN